MNKFILIAILPLLVIILTFKWSDAAAVSTGGSATFSQVGTIKRYVFWNVYSWLKFYFFCKVLQCNMSSGIVVVVGSDVDVVLPVI